MKMSKPINKTEEVKQNAKDYVVRIDEFVSGLEAEQNADLKRFYNVAGGTRRAKNAIAVLSAAITRLQQFVRA